MSAASVSASSLTPFSSTVWLSIGMPASTGREHERVAAGEDHLPDVRRAGDIAECRGECFAGQRLRAAGAHDLAPEAEAAVDRADVRQLQENAVAIALYDAGYGRQALLAQRVRALLRPLLQLT